MNQLAIDMLRERMMLQLKTKHSTDHNVACDHLNEDTQHSHSHYYNIITSTPSTKHPVLTSS